MQESHPITVAFVGDGVDIAAVHGDACLFRERVEVPEAQAGRVPCSGAFEHVNACIGAVVRVEERCPGELERDIERLVGRHPGPDNLRLQHEHEDVQRDNNDSNRADHDPGRKQECCGNEQRNKEHDLFRSPQGEQPEHEQRPGPCSKEV